MSSGRLRQLTGLLFTIVFVVIGIALILEERTEIGALMLAFAAFRGGLVAAQWNEGQPEEPHEPPAPQSSPPTQNSPPTPVP